MLRVRTVYDKSIPPIALGICVSFTPASTPVLHFDSRLDSDLSTLSLILSRICRSEKSCQKPKCIFLFLRLKAGGALTFSITEKVSNPDKNREGSKKVIAHFEICGICDHIACAHRV
jgi:hypothetical protein